MTTFVLDPATDLVASVPRSNRPFQRRQYRDKHFKGTEAEWKQKLDSSTTVYVGNLSAQMAESRTQFEKDLANFLVNLMKAAKPTLMKAFIAATLADKQLKEIAIGLFLNTTGSSDDDST